MLNYRIDFAINHKSKEFSGICDIKLDIPMEEIEFVIYCGVQIESVSSGNITLEYTECDFDELQFFPECKKITINGITSCDLRIQYKCKLESMTYNINSINDTWIELNMYSPWYPVRIDISTTNFDIKIRGLEDFQVVHGSQIDEVWQLKFIDQVDAYIIGFKEFNLYELADQASNVSIYSLKTSNISFPDRLNELLKNIFDFYTDLFGKSAERLELTVAAMDRLSGGGYFRDGLIVIS